ncbi:MAG TPA: argininosuccinate lyase, partial [Clostridiales bacterium]|nr:argininosuccinate lyase [Clostridiales bacterium]
KMKKATKEGFMNATDVADYLVKKGLPFRSAHEAVGKMVRYCVENQKAVEDLTLEELRRFSDAFEEDILEKVQIENCIASKVSYGSTAPQSVRRMIQNAKEYLSTL